MNGLDASKDYSNTGTKDGCVHLGRRPDHDNGIIPA